MCGIAGILSARHRLPADDMQQLVHAMNTAQAHRGPDDQGKWIDDKAVCALAHRRLSIIDCDPSGHQPMKSANGRFVISYNGEIYNYQQIRQELLDAGVEIAGGSDTGVLLAAIETWGIAATLPRMVGMFAFAVWDRHDQTLVVVRDRLGIKPIFWFENEGEVAFASQLKCIRLHPACPQQIDCASLASYVRHGYVPGSRSILNGVQKLAPGHYVTIPLGGEPVLTRYWDAREIAIGQMAEPYEHSFETAISDLDDLLSMAVGQRMIADVPLGVFLSGGIDSSLIASVMQKQSATPVKTFSIGFESKAYDESHHAAAIARHLGTDHVSLTATPSHALELVERLPEWYDEPFADSSQIPTLLLSKLTREHVTVALSGDGGDEVFAGYNRYFWAQRIWSAISPMPQWTRHGVRRAIGVMPVGPINSVGNLLSGLGMPRQLGDKLHKASRILSADSIDAVYRRLISQWDSPEMINLHDEPKSGVIWDDQLRHDIADPMARMQLLDMMTYLPDDILTKVDRASMAYALEVRVPLIDHRVIEFAWRLPRSFLVRDGKSKAILRALLYNHVPQQLIERPKTGFGAPIDEWLRGPLRDWAHDLLDPITLRDDGFFNVDQVTSALSRHQTGQSNMSYGLWTILMFQDWKRFTWLDA